MVYKTLVFDLDETLYPVECGLWEAIGERINSYMLDVMGFAREEIRPLRDKLYHQYGTTLRGLKMVYGVDEVDYLEYVHDVPLANYIKADERIRNVLLGFPQRRIIFTNGHTAHARRVLNLLNLEDCFDQIIDVLDVSPYCKPQPEAFNIMLEKAGGLLPNECILLDDNLGNVRSARQMGFHTVWVGRSDTSNGGADDYHAAVKTLLDLPLVLKSVLQEQEGGNGHHA